LSEFYPKKVRFTQFFDKTLGKLKIKCKNKWATNDLRNLGFTRDALHLIWSSACKVLGKIEKFISQKDRV